jgi:hypothetical protein
MCPLWLYKERRRKCGEGDAEHVIFTQQKILKGKEMVLTSQAS